MTVIKEYRIPLPISVDEYEVGMLWSVMEESKAQTGGGEGVEIVKNEPYEKPETGEKGQYTEKIYRMDSKFPKWVRMLFGEKNVKNMAYFEEVAWNAYPYCKTIVRNPKFMKEYFELKIETWHLDLFDQENVHKLPADVWKTVSVVNVDIAADIAKSDYDEKKDPCKLESKKCPERSPLDKNWLDKARQELKIYTEQKKQGVPDSENPKPKYMCVYKLITLRCRWRPMTWKIESWGHAQQERAFGIFHRQIYCWIDNWVDLTMEDIRRVEAEAKAKLEEDINKGEVQGMALSG